MTSAFQVFELLDGARREKPPRHHEAWDPAIAKEIRTLEEHGVFAVVDRPRGKGVKFETGRTVIRTDSIAGSTRGIDTNVFATCAARGMPPRGGDFSAAYLHVDEQFDIYAEIFPEYKKFLGKEVDLRGKVLKLKKKLWGQGERIRVVRTPEGITDARRVLPRPGRADAFPNERTRGGRKTGVSDYRCRRLYSLLEREKVSATHKAF